MTNDQLFRRLPAIGTSQSKADLILIINEQAHVISAIMGLLDGYGITRDNMSTRPGSHELSPYGRVFTMCRLLHKCGHIKSEVGKDVPNAYENRPDHGELVSVCEWLMEQLQGESGAGETYWETVPKYRAAVATIKKARGDV